MVVVEEEGLWATLSFLALTRSELSRAAAGDMIWKKRKRKERMS